jgi:hypothetical protein
MIGCSTIKWCWGRKLLFSFLVDPHILRCIQLWGDFFFIFFALSYEVIFNTTLFMQSLLRIKLFKNKSYIQVDYYTYVNLFIYSISINCFGRYFLLASVFLVSVKRCFRPVSVGFVLVEYNWGVCSLVVFCLELLVCYVVVLCPCYLFFYMPFMLCSYFQP